VLGPAASRENFWASNKMVVRFPPTLAKEFLKNSRGGYWHFMSIRNLVLPLRKSRGIREGRTSCGAKGEFLKAPRGDISQKTLPGSALIFRADRHAARSFRNTAGVISLTSLCASGREWSKLGVPPGHQGEIPGLLLNEEK